MASAQSKLFNVLLRLIKKKTLLQRQFAKGNFNSFSAPTPPAGIFKSFAVGSSRVSDRNVFTLRPKNGATEKHVLYLHGGAYVATFTRLHWNFIADIIKATNCVVTAPDYPLAPAHTYRDVFPMMIKVYRELLSSVNPDNLIVMGDSAGGGLALALAQELKVANLPQPAQIILLSPWLDLTLTDPGISNIDPSDPFTGIEGLRLAAMAYAGGDDPRHYQLSPINGKLDGLGKISMFAGTREILVSDARKLKALLDDAGVSANYCEYEDMIHVWMLLHFPESRKAKKEIVELIMSG